MNDRQPADILEDGTAEWERVLREYARSLDDYRALLTFIDADTLIAEPVPAAAEFVPPNDVPPLPDALLLWARSLVETTAGLTAWADKLSSRAQLRLSTRPARVSAPVRSRWEASL
ncbi:MAG: hypothetical protein JWL72_2166 [Ilumatobacteraceae bacterium]|nr:hypothetical protein [Ilumatobacteraceae bacterium]